MPDTQEIRKLFHDILNKLGSVTVKSGLYARMAEVKNYDAMTQEELLKEVKNFLEQFSLIEKAALDAGEITKKAKKVVYTSLNIDAPQ